MVLKHFYCANKLMTLCALSFLHRYCGKVHPSVEARLAFTGAYDGVIRVWDWREVGQKGGEAGLVGELTLHSSHVNTLCFDDQGRKLISADADGEVCVRPEKFIRLRTGQVMVQCFSPLTQISPAAEVVGKLFYFCFFCGRVIPIVVVANHSFFNLNFVLFPESRVIDTDMGVWRELA